MTRLEVLEEYRNQLNHNLLCYSTSYLMDKPKKEYRGEWEITQEKISIIEGMIKEEREEKMGFTKEQILGMYPDVKYYVRNSNGGLLAGAIKLNDAKKYAEKYKKEYLQDSLNNQLEVFVYDKHGHNVYVASGLQSNPEKEETEEFE